MLRNIVDTNNSMVYDYDNDSLTNLGKQWLSISDPATGQRRLDTENNLVTSEMQNLP
jgi:hypothetical protein